MAMLGAFPALSIPPNAFRFQPRHAGVDRHRFSAVDVERVAREGDVATLQEHIANVTFCNLAGERCPHCGQPADPVLLTVLRLAQLSIEYLLHCQQHLADKLALHAQHLQATRAQLARAQGLASEQAAQLRGEKEESRRWKKLVATQLLLQAGPSSYCKCHLCSKAFLSDILLQAHVQRRHLEATKAGFAETKQVERMEEEVEELKAKLHEVQQQLAAGRKAEKLRREQETERAHQKEVEGRKDLERWKEEERTKLRAEMDGLRQFFLTELKDAASRSSAMEGVSQEDMELAALPAPGGLADSQPKESHDLLGYECILGLEAAAGQGGPGRNVEPPETSWDKQLHPSMLQKLQELHARVAAVSSLGTLEDDDPEEMQRAPSWAELERAAARSTERRQALKDPRREQRAQVAQIKLLSAKKPEDRAEETLGGKWRLLEALRRNPNLLEKFRPILEEALEEKLESMGVRRVTKGISTQTYQHLRAVVRLQLQQKAEKIPGLLHLRDKLIQAVTRRVRRSKKPVFPLPRQLSIIPGTAASTKGKLLERCLDATTWRPAGGMKSQP